MAFVRSSGYKLKDPDDDAALQVVIGDLQRLALAMYKGTKNSAYTLTPAAASNIGSPTEETGDSSGVAQEVVVLTTPTGTVNGSVTPWTTETYNKGGFTVSLGAGTVTPPSAGYYSIEVLFTFATGALGFGVAYFYSEIRINGVSSLVVPRQWTYTNGTHSLYNKAIVLLAGTDTVSVSLNQNGGAGAPAFVSGYMNVVRVADDT